MCLLRERLNDFKEKHFTNSPRVKQSDIELIALYVHPNDSNQLDESLEPQWLLITVD